MTVESLASTTATLDDVELQGEVPVPQEHDQLPPVEQYKAQQTSSKVLGTMEIEQADNAHDQLPNIEEYKVDHDSEPISSRKTSLRSLGIALVVLVVMVTIIVVPLVLTKNDHDDDDGSSGSVSRIPAVADYLEALAISQKSDMRREGSPQNRALKWIADDDDYQLALPDKPRDESIRFRQLQGPPATRNPFVERYSLAVFYYSLGGPKWNYQLKFLDPIDHCDWYGNFYGTDGSILRFGVIDCKAVEGVNYVSKIGASK
jgi:hypothetical protein